MKSFRKILFNEEGSAVVEFITLALPLFIPLFIYLNQYAYSSDHESSLRTLSREMARAFVTSENDSVAEKVTYEVFVKGANILGYGKEISEGTLKYQFECKNNPCISPDNEIRIRLIDQISGKSIAAVEYVSPWA